MTERIIQYLLQSAVGISGGIIIILMVRLWLRKISGLAAYTLWIFLLVQIVLPVNLFGIHWSADFAGKSSEKYTGQQEKAGEVAAIKTDPVMKNVETESTGDNKEQNISNRKIPEKTYHFPAREKENVKRINFADVAFFIWMPGCVLLWGYFFALQMLGSLRLRNIGHCVGNIYRSEEIVGSFVKGILVPKIYVQSDLDEEEMTLILAHETYHIYRKDYLVKPVAFLIFSLYWFNPLIWIAYRCMVKDMEISCDNHVLKELGEDCRKKYSMLLVKCAQEAATGRLNGKVFFGKNTIKERIENIMSYKRSSKMGVTMAVISVILCGCGVFATNTVPESTTGNPDRADGDTDYYVEKTMTSAEEAVLEGVEEFGGMYVDDNDILSEIAIKKEGNRNVFQKAQLIDDAWVLNDVSWNENLQKKISGKDMVMSGGYYGKPGYLYLLFGEQSRDRKKLIRNILYRVDESNGSVYEIEVPQKKVRDVFHGKVPEGYADGDEIIADYLSVFESGNFVIESDGIKDGGEIRGIYDGITGEKRADAELTQSKNSNIYTGNGFFCYSVIDQKKKEFSIMVHDEDGKYEYAIPTGLPYENEMPGFAIAVNGNKIVMATKEGIYEAEYGDDTFSRIVDVKTDNVYYMTLDYMYMDAVYCDKQDNYYVQYSDENNGDMVLCKYTKKKTS